MILILCRLFSSISYLRAVPQKSEECIEFGRLVRFYRVGVGLSQEELASRAKIHRTYIGGIERGERNPTLVMIHRLAEALDVPAFRLLKAPASGVGETGSRDGR
jgi:transcriptional regulator with XRE-family HTH domain